ncbi:hypothetical protein D3C76_651340 [compost metagenome]
MLQFVGQRREKPIEQQAGPPGQVSTDVQRCRAEHSRQGKGQNGHADGVLVPEHRKALAQSIAMGHNHLANMRRSLLCIERAATCRRAIRRRFLHASILLL